MIDRYGGEIEADLLAHFSGLDIVDFWRRRHSWGRLASLVSILERRSDSYLTWAKSKDTEAYRAARDAGALRNNGGRPESFEMDQPTQIAAGMYGLLQELLKASPRVKKFTPKQWPMPETAAALVKREDADQGYDDLMDDIVFVDQDEFERHIAQHADEESILRIEREANGDN